MQRLFTSVTAPNDEAFYKEHLPTQLYTLFSSIDLIKQPQKCIEKNKETFILELKAETISHAEKISAACFSITHTSLISMTSTVTTYLFVKQNAYRSDYLGEDGLDYIGEPNKKALLWSDNFLCQDNTKQFAHNIISTLTNIDDRMTKDINNINQIGCQPF